MIKFIAVEKPMAINKSTVVGAVVALALGAVAVHAIGGIGTRPQEVGEHLAPAAAKPMSPLQMMRHAREVSDESVGVAF